MTAREIVDAATAAGLELYVVDGDVIEARGSAACLAAFRDSISRSFGDVLAVLHERTSRTSGDAVAAATSILARAARIANTHT
jgi:hypothetical protein